MTLANGVELNVINIGIDEANSNYITITLINDDFRNLKKLFSNPDNLSTITHNENEYKGYTEIRTIYSQWDADAEDTLTNICLRYTGNDVLIDSLTEELKQSKEQVEMLTACILEIGDIIYSQKGDRI